MIPIGLAIISLILVILHFAGVPISLWVALSPFWLAVISYIAVSYYVWHSKKLTPPIKDAVARGQVIVQEKKEAKAKLKAEKKLKKKEPATEEVAGPDITK